MLTRKQAMVVTILTTVCCPGCGALRGSVPPASTGPAPPARTDDINRTWTGLDGLTFHTEGDDSTAWRFVGAHGWEIFGGHGGGAGDTLQIVDPSGGMVLIWAYNSFSGFILSEGWTGQTANGTRIGTTLAEFNELHPEFTEDSPGYLRFETGTTQVTVTFDEDLLSEIDVRDY